MIIRTLTLAVSALAVLIVTHPHPAQAGGYKPQPRGSICLPDHSGGGNTYNKYTNINKSITINKPVTVNKNIDVSKNIWINKPITVNKSIDLSKNINIEKNIDLSKNININKSIVINKGTNIDIDVDASASAYAEASANAYAEASAQAAVQARVNMFTQPVYGRGGGGSYVTVINKGGDIGALAVANEAEAGATCTEQWATVIKSIHAECVDRSGGKHPATRMRKETWLDSSQSSEIYRCLEGSNLRAIIGDVVQSDQGMAGIYEGGKVLACGPGEALRHFKDGLVKCAIAEKVPDCTERTNLRDYGIGDVFFSYQTKVCARIASETYEGKSSGGRAYSAASSELQISGMGLDGGVGYYGQ